MPAKNTKKQETKRIVDAALLPYYIKFDAYGVNVFKLPDGTIRQSEEMIGSHSNFTNAIICIINHKMADGEGIQSLSSYLKDLEVLTKEIVRKYNEYLPLIPKKRRIKAI